MTDLEGPRAVYIQIPILYPYPYPYPYPNLFAYRLNYLDMSRFPGYRLCISHTNPTAYEPANGPETLTELRLTMQVLCTYSCYIRWQVTQMAMTQSGEHQDFSDDPL